MPVKKEIEFPALRKELFYGPLISCDFHKSITTQHGFYIIPYTLSFASGTVLQKQKGGFKRKADAETAKEHMIAQFHNHQLITISVTFSELFLYWLYYYQIKEKKITYNTYQSYRNVIMNYLLIDDKFSNIPITKVTVEQLTQLLEDIPYDSIFKSACRILKMGMEKAIEWNYLNHNLSNFAIYAARNKRKEKKQNKMEWHEDYYPEKEQTLTANEAAYFLFLCKDKEIFMPMLFTITCGLRVSEAIAVKFSDIDFGKKELHVQRQLGRQMELSSESISKKRVSTQELNPKTFRGNRTIPLAPFVIDEIILAKHRYQKWKKDNPDFCDDDYITIQKNGKPYYTAYIHKEYQKFLQQNQLPAVRWHALRKSYSTLLAKEGISMKAISVCMGHYSENFTNKVYVIKEETPLDAAEVVNRFVNDLSLTLKTSPIDLQIDLSKILDE